MDRLERYRLDTDGRYQRLAIDDAPAVVIPEGFDGLRLELATLFA